MATLTKGDRELLRAIKRSTNERFLEQLGNVRAYRNLIVAATVVLCGFVIAIPTLAGVFDLSFVSIYKDQTDASIGATQFATIEFWGAVGGLVGALTSLRRIRARRGPYGIHVAQLLLKLPAGALVAVFTIVLVQGGLFKQITVVDRQQIAAYAVLFGFAQEAVTRLVDRRASEIAGAQGEAGK